MYKEPKFGHLRDLHNVIRSYQKAFLLGKHSFEILGHGYEVGNSFFNHFCSWKLVLLFDSVHQPTIRSSLVFFFFERNIFFGVVINFLYCRHKSLSCLKKTYASLSFPTITQGKMEQWSSEGKSTMCLAVLSPFLQGARTWFTIPREYVCLHLTTTELGI